MSEEKGRYLAGEVRDTIRQVLAVSARPMCTKEIEENVRRILGPTPSSSIRSSLRLNTPNLFVRESRGQYSLHGSEMKGLQDSAVNADAWNQPFSFGHATLWHNDCFQWLKTRNDKSIHAVVTDPPYGLHEYSEEQQTKRRNGKGGVWRIPPSFDGHTRSPLPRFTTLTEAQLEDLKAFFFVWARLLLPKLVPGAHVVVASNPLVSHMVSTALDNAGLERRGEIIRLTMTMRGGDRPKQAHKEFSEISVMPRSMWEPWIIFRKPLEGRVQDNLRKWKTGGFRRPCKEKPFGDVLQSSPTRKQEREIAPHPSLKPQDFLRKVVRGVLPLGEGIVLDPFAGSGAILAAAEAVGYASAGVEKDAEFFHMACNAIPKLRALRCDRS